MLARTSSRTSLLPSSSRGTSLPCLLCMHHIAPRWAAWTARHSSAIVRSRPAGLTLSDKVAQSADPARPKSGTLYPTGGLNQRVANIPLKRLRREKLSRDVPVPAAASAKGRKPEKISKPKPEFKHLKMARALEPISQYRKQELRETLKTEQASSFDEYTLLPQIVQSLRKDVLSDLTTIDPTPIQRLAIPALLKQDITAPCRSPAEYLLAAETGSGKTLAYFLPLLHHLKRAEIHEQEMKEAERAAREAAAASNSAEQNLISDPEALMHPNTTPPPRPRAVILLPTAELVNQVGKIAKRFSHIVKFRTALLSREFSPKAIKTKLNNRPDLIISTPHLLSSIAQSEPGILGKCLVLVADEADSLLDRSFEEITQSITIRADKLKQLILCSATIPRGLDARLRKHYPNIKRLVTPNLHAIPRRIQMTIVDVEGDPYRGNKMLACADVLYGIARDSGEEGFVKKVVVFVNEREMTGPLTDYLRSKKIDAVELTRDAEARMSDVLNGMTALEYFTGPKEEDPLPSSPSSSSSSSSPSSPSSNPSPVNPKEALQRMKVLVTTDIASRGVDTKTVKNVILYDVPFSTVDFIHRMGRTGRMGRRGRAVVLVDKKTNRAWVKEVKLAMHMGQGLV